MLAKEMISDLIPPVTAGDTGSRVLSWMDLYRVSQLPVVEDKMYVGLVTDTELLNLSTPEQPIGESIASLAKICVFPEQHILELIESFLKFKLHLLPVISTDGIYLGAITQADLIRGVASITAAGQPGAIIELSLLVRDYSLANISRIVEENSARIVTLYTSPGQDGDDLMVTMKLNTPEVASIIRSFQRFGYVVREHFMADEQLNDLYRERLEEFMRYINM
ncbi:MAG: CBS domain-containing protein [Bacteroidales bacterium]|jgi:CBS domain-containing protein|nr:CBS domain-containing protein [Bacteroidales bacterium]MDD3385295.1 CBS domain-containing protein [Bacteroidales bacterium]